MLTKEVVETTESAPVYGTDKLSIRTWIRIAWVTCMVCTALIIILSVGLYQRKTAIRNAYEKTSLVRSGKAGLLEAGFRQWTELIRNFSANTAYATTLTELSEAGKNLENDNFATPGASTPGEVKSLVEGYYSASVLPLLEERSGKTISYRNLLPTENYQWILQYLYMASQPDAHTRYTRTRAADGSTYTATHALFHPEMIRYAREKGIQDILLVDYSSGVVVYSLLKNPDFGTSLYDGPYRNSAMAMAFKTALGMPAGSVFITDFELYPATGMKPTWFMASPVYEGADLIGAVVFSFGVTAIDHMLAIQSDAAISESGQSVFLLGNDLMYRSTDPAFSAGPAKFLRKLKRNSTRAGEYENASRLGTTVLVQSVDRGKFGTALAGKEGQTRYTTETGQDVLCSFEPVVAGNQNLILVSQLELSSALRPVKRLVWFMAGLSVLLILLTYLGVHYHSGRLSARILRLSNALGHIGSYKADGETKHEPSDEIGVTVDKVVEIDNRIRNVTGVVLKMAAGEIDNHFEAAGDDLLAKALLKLKDSLISQREADALRKQADDIQNWSSRGVAMFNEILRSDNDNMERLCLNIIRNLIQYLSANQGGMFLIEEEDGKRELNLTAAYAFDRQKFIQKRIGLGEGLAGTCALEKKTILLSRIPDNYIEITSGLGGSKPGCILIVPLKKEEEVLGVIEIASFEAFKPHEVEFAEKVAESIASALITVQLHLQTSLYLERFRQQAEEMKAQDEELRQNIEELQATHEQMERMKQEEEEHNRLMVKEVEDNRKLLLMVLDQIPGKIFLKDNNGALLLLNSEVARVYHKSVEELIGTTDFDNHPEEDARIYREKELEIIANGAQTYIQEESLTGDVRYLKTTKMPFYIPHLDKTGLLGIQLEVSDFVKLEMQNKEKEKALEQNQQLFIDIIDKIPAKIFLKDEHGVFVVVNSAVSSVYNKTVKQIIGTSDFDNHPNEDVDSWRKQETEIMEKGENTYTHVETSNGVTRHLKTIKMPFRIATSGKTGLLGIQFDITREKELEEALRQQRG